MQVAKHYQGPSRKDLESRLEDFRILKARRPKLTWEQIAQEMNISERTLWRYRLRLQERNGMPKRQEGDIVVAQNGYAYKYVMRDGRLTRVSIHWLAGIEKYGRPPTSDERVRLQDSSKRGVFDPDNVVYVATEKVSLKSLQRRQTTIEDKIRELQSDLVDVQKAIKQYLKEDEAKRANAD